MDSWVDARRTLALEESANNLGSSIQQIYFSLNHESISAGNLTNKLNTQPLIEGYPYRGNATLRTILDPAFNSSKILDVNLKFVGLEISVTTSVTLGQNVEWLDTTFTSNSTQACVAAEKFSNGTILLYFGVRT